MDVPFWVGDREFDQADLDLIRLTVRRFSRFSREEITATLCENLPWRAPNGRLKMEACRKLLLQLEQEGLVTLPPLCLNKVRKGVHEERKGTAVQLELRASLRDVSPVVVEPATTAQEREIWNATMAAHHPLGYRRPIGAHQRYFIRVQTNGGSQIVGLLLFGAAAKVLADRERWIDWTPEERTRYRVRIVNNNRFLVLPQVRIPHLASHVLSLAARRIQADWSARYGYAPVLLETFVEPEHAGTCYRAANWILVGQTAGRGRQDRYSQYRESVKSIWMYPLQRDWRRRLVEPLPQGVDPSDEWEG
ncbi:MAG: Druantia anti-phage system protein DruA [Vulcanimicrobiaceae bacterium]